MEFLGLPCLAGDVPDDVDGTHPVSPSGAVRNRPVATLTLSSSFLKMRTIAKAKWRDVQRPCAGGKAGPSPLVQGLWTCRDANVRGGPGSCPGGPPCPGAPRPARAAAPPPAPPPPTHTPRS